MTNTTAGFEPDTKENLKILVVDDEPDVQPMVRQAMRPEIRSGKYSFLFAGNGDEALEQLDQNQDIQILISDINMPRMDGLTLLDHLSERNADLRSIIVSAYGDMKNIRQAMNRGAFDFITKPLDFEDLRVTIERSRNNLLKWRRAMEARDRLMELEYELSMASRMQKAILPTTFPDGPDHEIHGCMNPAHEVSGDFFDVINLDQGRIGVAIADVSGKGVPAALFMMSSRTILKAAAIGLQEPASVLEEVNSLIHKDNENTMFITLLYAVYDPRTGLLTYANGGHCNPLLLHPQQGCTELPSTQGVALGLSQDHVYQETTVTVPPGGTVVMYTDGVSEAMNSDEQEFGEERLRILLQDKRPAGAQQANSMILEAVREHTGGIRQFDDITCLTLHRKERTP